MRSRSAPGAVDLGATRTESRGQAAALLLAGLALGYALQLRNGLGYPPAFLALGAALLFAVVGVFLPRLRALEAWGDRPALLIAGVGLVFEFGQLFTTPPGIYLRLPPGGLVPFFGLLAAAAVVGGGLLAEKPLLGRLQLPLLLVVHFALGVWLLGASPGPFIDVFVFQRDGLEALLQGQNPYTHRFPDIWDGKSPFYGPGLSVDGWLQFGFPYPPLSLLLVLPGQLLGGDYRFAQLAAMTLSGGLMAASRNTPLSRAVAAVFLFSPRTFFILEQGWTEPLLVGVLSSTVFAACRLPRLTPWLFGVLAGLKQYAVFAVPAYLLLLPRPWTLREATRHAAKGAGLALGLSLPLVLWDVGAFYRSVVALQFHQPFRRDSLSFLVWSVNTWGWPPESLYNVIPVGLALSAALLAVWRAPRTPTGFAAAVGFTLLVWFAFTKQSFCNHYYFPLGALFLGAAAHDPKAGEAAAPRQRAGRALESDAVASVVLPARKSARAPTGARRRPRS